MANDFSADTHCKALWKLDNGALVADSIGTNTLTNSGVASETTLVKEGDGSGSFVASESDSLTITDAALDSGFPLKSGETNTNISVCFWHRPTVLTPGASTYIFSKYKYTTPNRSFQVGTTVSATDQVIRLSIGWNSGASFDAYLSTVALSVDTWYHVAATWNDSTREYQIIVTPDGGSPTIDSDIGLHNINVSTANVYLGASGNPDLYIDGYLDEVVVFDDVLTAAEVAKIYAGTYGAAAPASTQTKGLNRLGAGTNLR
jgi:hypothetical protein